MHDPHTQYIKPLCYSALKVLPVALALQKFGTELSIVTQQQVVNGVDITSELGLGLLVGWRVMYIDGVDAVTFLSDWATRLPFSSDRGISFSAAVVHVRSHSTKELKPFVAKLTQVTCARKLGG